MPSRILPSSRFQPIFLILLLSLSLPFLARSEEGSVRQLAMPAVPKEFKHPGILHTAEELQKIKKNIEEGKDPWKTAFEQMKGTPWADLNYEPHGRETIKSGIRGAGSKEGGAGDASRDAVAAYTQALMWVFTGDERYAKNAVKILDAWSVLRNTEGGNWYLHASWIAPHLVNAAELMRATYPAWKQEKIDAFSRMLNEAFLPIFHRRLSYGNRHFSVIYAMMAIGVFNNDRAAFAEGMHRWISDLPCWIYVKEDGPEPRKPDYWLTLPSDEKLAELNGGRFPNSDKPWVFCAGEVEARMKELKLGDDRSMLQRYDVKQYWYRAPQEAFIDGLSAETYRDLGHCDLALGGIGGAAEVAWHQGIDLYGMEAKRLAPFLELHSMLRISESIPPAFYRVKGSPIHPTFDIVFNHYQNRAGVDLPYTRKFLEKALRPCLYKQINGAPSWAWVEVEPGVRAENIAYPAVCNMAWETLTHADLDKR